MNRAALNNPKVDVDRFHLRLLVAFFICVLLLGVLAARLFFLQVLKYDFYHTQAEANRIALVPVAPSRGLILDRNGVVLAHNYSAYTLEITPSKVDDLKTTIESLRTVLPVAAKDEKRFYKLLEESKDFAPIPIRTRLTDEEIARFASQAYRFPGVEIQARLFRNYPLGESTSHVLGYIGRISEADADALDDAGKLTNYKGSDHIGKTGLEQQYEDQLHGTTGYAEVETDANNRAVRTLRTTPPVPGNNLVLSLDVRLQQYAEQLFAGRRGALVAIDPRDGGVLALVSEPGYDPNSFVDGIDADTWRDLNDSPDHPLTNRALRGTYPPGSTFKPFMALSALNLGIRTPNQITFDPGYFQLPGGSHQWRDDKPGGHGAVDLHKAIVVSCDTYFYKLASDMGIDHLSQQMTQYGFGHKSGIDLPGELDGILPSQQWKQQRFAKYPEVVRRWYAGDVVSIGIGQGYNAYTPLQMAVATAMIANRGKIVQPHVVKDIQLPNGKMTPLPVSPPRQLAIKPENLELINQAMIDVVRAGTAAGISKGLQYTLAGKTGTAQVYSLKGSKYSAHHTEEHLRDHAWFIAYAPAEHPTIALAVIVENAGFGATSAAPIARKVIDFHLLGAAAAGPPVTPDMPAKKPAASPAAAVPAKPASPQGDDDESD